MVLFWSTRPLNVFPQFEMVLGGIVLHVSGFSVSSDGDEVETSAE